MMIRNCSLKKLPSKSSSIIVVVVSTATTATATPASTNTQSAPNYNLLASGVLAPSIPLRLVDTAVRW